MGLLENIPENANKLDPKSITVSRIIYGIISLVPAILSVVIFINSGEWHGLYIPLSFAILFFLFGFFWAKKDFKHSYWWYQEEGLYIQRGVLWRKRILVPRNRVQHTDVAQGPLERRYGLGKLIVHTAGTRDASVTLRGVALETANDLRNKLIDEDHADAV